MYEFENPRGLSLGAFDLAFVLTHLLPLGLIALTAWRLSAERDSGALRLIAAQPASARAIVAAKFGAVALVTVPLALAAMWLALALARVPIFHGRLLTIQAVAALAVAGYASFWIGLAACVASRTGAIASAATLVAMWIVLVFLVPAIGALALGTLHPAPSRLQYLDVLRRESDWTDKRRDDLIKAYLAVRPAYAAGVDRIVSIPYATKQIAVQMELERRLHDRTTAFDRARAAASRRAAVLRLLSPSLVLDEVLQSAAGSDAGRQEIFLRRAREYTDRLRGFFWPRALKDAAQPTTNACNGCPAKMSFLAHDEIPKFVDDDPVMGVAARVSPLAVHLWLFAAVTALVAWRIGGFRM